MTSPAGRILYLALADAPGHLMRAHLLSGALGEAGLAVDVVTTSRDGVRFLASMGRGSRLLSEHFRVEFGDRHDMSRRRTEARVASYLLLPWRAIADLRRLAVLGRGADLVVNDSLHPALLLAPALGFPHPGGLASAYGRAQLHALRRAGRRLGRGHLDVDGPEGAGARRRAPPELRAGLLRAVGRGGADHGGAGLSGGRRHWSEEEGAYGRIQASRPGRAGRRRTPRPGWLRGSSRSCGDAQLEKSAHPRIASAIDQLESAIRYLEAAPHDFGGHRANAVRASKDAVRELREALQYSLRSTPPRTLIPRKPDRGARCAARRLAVFGRDADGVGDPDRSKGYRGQPCA